MEPLRLGSPLFGTSHSRGCTFSCSGPGLLVFLHLHISPIYLILLSQFVSAHHHKGCTIHSSFIYITIK